MSYWLDATGNVLWINGLRSMDRRSSDQATHLATCIGRDLMQRLAPSCDTPSVLAERWCSRRRILDLAQPGQQSGNIRHDDAPQGVVVDAQVAVNQPVACSDDQAPWHIWMRSTDRIRYMRCGLPDQLQVAHRRVVDEAARNERLLIQPGRSGNHLLGEMDHVVDVKAPLAVDCLRHEPPHPQ
jgi:hypothetical protein